MTGVAPNSTPLPRWLPAMFLLLLTLPLHPFWLDFEQVRRGLLLLLTGAVLLWRPSLPPLPAGAAMPLLWFFGWNLLSAAVHVARANDWEAAYRLLHYVALAVVLRLGVATGTAVLAPASVLVLITSSLGLLQRLDLLPLGGYGTIAEPVSVFGNLNVAAEFTAVSAVASLLLASTRPRLACAALFVAGAYLAVNGTRAPLVALPLALLAQHLGRRGMSPSWRAVAAMLLGAAVGLALPAIAPAPQSTPPPAETTTFAAQRYTASLPLRLQIAHSCARMALDAPVLGCGPGQFAVQYPRFRSQEEIESSSYGRAFATEVRTAHDDWLETLVEGGLPALLLLLLSGWRLLRGNPHAPILVAVGALMAARAPLFNAPAIATALFIAAAGFAAPAVASRRPGTIAAQRLVGLLLIACGALPVLGNTLFADYQTPRARGEGGDMAALARAAAVQPFEPRYLQLQAQQQLFGARTVDDLRIASSTAERALVLRPFEVNLLLLLGEIRLRLGDGVAAKAVSEQVFALDPSNPEAQMLLAGVWCTQRKHDAAARFLFEDPHPRLRARLGETFRTLEAVCKQQGDRAGENRYAAERSLLVLLPLLGASDAAQLAKAQELVKAMMQNFGQAGLLQSDVRPYAAAALHALDAHADDLAAEMAHNATQLHLVFEPWQRAVFGDRLDRLQRLVAWQPLLSP